MSDYLLVKSNDDNFGVPEQKKFPLPDARHVKSAIKFFNYVEPRYEKQLAKAILEKAKMYNVDLSEMNIGDNNRFKKYLTKNELKHFGIQGMKWGVRRFQNLDGSYTQEGLERYGRNSDGKKKVKPDDHYSKDARYYKKKGTAISTALGVLGTAALAYGAYKMYQDSGKNYCSRLMYLGIMGGGAVTAVKEISNLNSRKNDKRLFEKSEFKSVKDLPKSKKNYNKRYFSSKNGTESSKELRHNINPDYPKPGGNRNCMLCTTAMVMRLKGYDVQANTVSEGFESYKPEDWFRNCTVKKVNKKSKPEDVMKRLKSQGNGAYGNLMVGWKLGGGHSILYTVKNGEVELIDGQANCTFKFDDVFKFVNMRDVSYVQLNDAIPNDIVVGLLKSNK